MKRTAPSPVEPSRAVLDALEILESFCANPHTQTLAEISRRLEIPKATALRHLKALEMRGYVLRDRDRPVYSLGLRLLSLSEGQYERFDHLAAARPILAELAAATGETAHYGVREGSDIVYLEVVESPQRVRAYVRRGDRLPAHAVAAGKVILAYGAAEVVDRLLSEPLKVMTAATIIDAAALRRELQRTRLRGYGLNVGEWQNEVTGISAPVFALGRGVVAAIGIAGPRSRLSRDKLADTGELIRHHADRLSESIGAAPEIESERPNGNPAGKRRSATAGRKS
jgi:IclR family acetate operon transcriptional repressor